MKDRGKPIVCFVRETNNALSETFINDIERKINLTSISAYGDEASIIGKDDEKSILQIFKERITSELYRSPITGKYAQLIKRHAIDIMFAHFGHVGAKIAKACTLTQTPLITCFRGHDAFSSAILKQYGEKFEYLFESSHKLIAVSKDIERHLISLGANPEALITIPSGVDCEAIKPNTNKSNGGSINLISIGRLVDKKAPDLTIKSVIGAHKIDPRIRLTLIGDGPLLEKCRKLIELNNAQPFIKIVGALDHQSTLAELLNSDIYIQHCVTPPSGDKEGTPNSIMEASAAGLPTLSTWHGGIPELVIDQRGGLLSNEHDIESMTKDILKLSASPELRQRLGSYARRHVETYFNRKTTISLLESCIKKAHLENRLFSAKSNRF